MLDDYITNWTKQQYPNFTPDEMRCKETGELNMSKQFMDKLQQLRDIYGRQIIITSGFRSVHHSEERNKLNAGYRSAGYHTKGIAVDIACFSDVAYDIVEIALSLGFTGVGVSQREGRGRFIHLDMRPKEDRRLYGY